MYGIAEYAKKDAPNKMGRKSGRRAEAAKKAVPLKIPAVAKCTYGVNGEWSRDIGGASPPRVLRQELGGTKTLTIARLNTHSHIFKADASLMSFLALSDWVMVAGSTPSMARLRVPKSQKEEEATPVRIARPNGSIVR